MSLIFFAMSFVHGYAQEIDRERLLESIAQAETGGRDDAVGAAGERWRWQILSATWRLHSAQDISSASPAEAARVALAELARITAILAASGREVSVKSLALEWHRGPHKKHVSAGALDYAESVSGTYILMPLMAALQSDLPAATATRMAQTCAPKSS